MTWLMDTYSPQVGHPVPEIMTGKPIVLGGTHGRPHATSLGSCSAWRRRSSTWTGTFPASASWSRDSAKVGSVVVRELAAGARRSSGYPT